MITLSLKLDDDIFADTEEVTTELKMARNRYINEALKIYNKYNKRKLLKSQLVEESKAAYANSMEILEEFEQLLND